MIARAHVAEALKLLGIDTETDRNIAKVELYPNEMVVTRTEYPLKSDGQGHTRIDTVTTTPIRG